jgi:hypothetical protein
MGYTVWKRATKQLLQLKVIQFYANLLKKTKKHDMDKTRQNGEKGELEIGSGHRIQWCKWEFSE